ncbi:dynamin family protein [Vreelandella glaciei]|mgnify:CR=1 FL=1|uniref:dynamin family protein n=1 Tax=Vreelandella glaciei TaxID=186761 RepID=UPI0030EE3B36|tara:strand:- start:29878 stop:31419 length:1542 start_codon:yes stop_codon:yes gene_type:complete
MGQLILSQAIANVDRLASFWVLRRRPIAAAIHEVLHIAEQSHKKQTKALHESLAYSQQLKSELGILATVQGQLETDLDKAESEQKSLYSQLIHKQAEYINVSSRYDLIASLLRAKPQDNSGQQHFKYLLENDFMRFANQVASLPDEAQAVIELQGVAEELALVAGFPGIHGKNLIAVAGGFSSGKSEFVNSFIQDASFRLAVGLNPVTAIPAYVSGAKNSQVLAFSSQGGSVPLTMNEFHALTHDFVRDFAFDLKTVMPYVSLSTQLGDKGFEHICFIDTPGYDPAATGGFTQHDHDIALQYASQAGVVFWVIGLDVNGTLPNSDLEFLRELLNITTAPFYIIANKADLRAEEDIAEILDEIEEVLEFEEIPIEGICAYSSVLGCELQFRGRSLFDYLSVKNRAVEKEQQLIKQVSNVFDRYRRSIDEDIERSARMSNCFRSLHLDILQTGDEELFLHMGKRFEELRNEFTSKSFQHNLEVANEIEGKMVKAIEDSFKLISTPIGVVGCKKAK